MSNYYPALLKARQAMGKLVKNKENPHFKSKYADLAAVLEVITDPLMDAGILLEQFPTVADGLVTVDTLLTHAESGESEGHSFSLPVDGRPTVQSVGSTLTYARRYALLAIFGLAPEDDDGNEASASKQAPAQRKTAPPVQKAPQQRTAAQEIMKQIDNKEIEYLEGSTTVSAKDEGYNGTSKTASALDTRPDWKAPSDAEAWAVEVGACENQYEAHSSFVKIVKASQDTRVNSSTLPGFFDAFYARQMEKLGTAAK